MERILESVLKCVCFVAPWVQNVGGGFACLASYQTDLAVKTRDIADSIIKLLIPACPPVYCADRPSEIPGLPCRLKTGRLWAVESSASSQEWYRAGRLLSPSVTSWDKGLGQCSLSEGRVDKGAAGSCMEGKWQKDL